MFVDDPEVTAAEAVIDNGPFGKRVVRFETGRLAKQHPLLRALRKHHRTCLERGQEEHRQYPGNYTQEN